MTLCRSVQGNIACRSEKAQAQAVVCTDTSSLEKPNQFPKHSSPNSLSLLYFKSTSKALLHPHSSKDLAAITDIVEALMGAFDLCMAADAH